MVCNRKRSVKSHMYRNENISARTKNRQAKEESFNRNIPILNILFYIGNGFMLKKQMVTLARIFYQINEHRANDILQTCSPTAC